jgi:C4-type Zn-finger protein
MRATKDLHLCGSCRRPFVVPEAIVNAPRDAEGVLVELLCANCGWRDTAIHSPSDIEALDRALDLSERQIRTALEICELERELERIDVFAEALQADLIVPEDF